MVCPCCTRVYVPETSYTGDGKLVKNRSGRCVRCDLLHCTTNKDGTPRPSNSCRNSRPQ